MWWRNRVKNKIATDPNHVYPKILWSDRSYENYCIRSRAWINGDFRTARSTDKWNYIEKLNDAIIAEIASLQPYLSSIPNSEKNTVQKGLSGSGVKLFYNNTTNQKMPPVTDLSVIRDMGRIMRMDTPSEEEEEAVDKFVASFENYREKVIQREKGIASRNKYLEAQSNMLKPQTMEERTLARKAAPMMNILKSDPDFMSAFRQKVSSDGLVSAYKMLLQCYDNVHARNNVYDPDEEIRKYKNALIFGIGFQTAWNAGNRREAERKANEKNKPNGFWD